jgi:hypothetical protein
MDRIGDYLVTWAVRYSELEPSETITQVLRVPEDIAWMCLPSLQLLVDKIGKPFNSVFGYTDAMLHEGLLRGVDMVNHTYPPTNYSLREMKGNYGLFDYVLLGAAIRVLTWQGILEIDQAFDFSGQTITLNHNRDYEGIVGRLVTEMERMEEIKTTVYRRSVPVGALGVRYQSYRNLSQPELMMTRDGPVNQTFSLLVRLGLI